MRSEVGVQFLSLGGGTTSSSKSLNANDANAPRLRERQCNSDAQCVGRFRHARAIDADMAAGYKLGRETARLEKSCMPKPLVEPLCVGHGYVP